MTDCVYVYIHIHPTSLEENISLSVVKMILSHSLFTETQIVVFHGVLPDESESCWRHHSLSPVRIVFNQLCIYL